MGVETLPTEQDILELINEWQPHETNLQRKLRQESATLGVESACTDPQAALALVVLSKLIGASRVLEVSLGTGYYTLRLVPELIGQAKAVVSSSQQAQTELALRYYKAGKVLRKVQLLYGPTRLTLSSLRQNSQENKFDMAIVSPALVDSVCVYESALDLVRPGGVVALIGSHISPTPKPGADKAKTKAGYALNVNIRRDSRVHALNLKAGPGILVALKKHSSRGFECLGPGC